MDANTSWMHWIIPGFPIVVFLLNIYIWRQKKKQNSRARPDYSVMLLSTYIAMLATQFSMFSSGITEQLKGLRDVIGSTNIKALSNPSESEILGEIGTVVDRENPNMLSVHRLFVTPGLSPGKGPQNDFLYGRTFFAAPFAMRYLVGFPWDGKEPQEYENRIQQEEMLAFLVSILEYPEWDQYENKRPLMQKLQVFHYPGGSRHESWVVEGKRTAAAITYLRGKWGRGTHPVRGSVLLLNDEDTNIAVREELESMLEVAILHLSRELEKPNPWDRCPCALFAAEDAHLGLQPLNKTLVIQKIKETTAMAEFEGNLATLPYSLRALNLASSISRN